MTPQERDLITQLFGRLQQAGAQAKDRDAEALIRDGIAAVPEAPYLLVQTVLIEDMALTEAHNRIKELEQQLADAKTAPQAPATSFLGGARASVPSAGPWGRAASAPQPATGPVWTQGGTAAPAAPAPASGMAQLAAPGASSGFLRQAATTAAGIAGGALLFQGISSLFGPHYGGGMFGGMQAQPGLGETVINNYYNSDTAQDQPNLQQADAGYADDPGMAQPDDGQDFGSDGGSVDV